MTSAARSPGLGYEAAKRCFDIAVATTALLCLAPVLLVIGLAVKASSAGPVFYRAERVGRHSRQFVMHKFRTMRIRPTTGSRITGPNDDRTTPVGSVLRRTKLDELPQLFDVLRGAMSIVGPRPEDPVFVRLHYTSFMLETLAVRPGLTSPGSLFGTTHGDALLAKADRSLDVEAAYAIHVLPIKLAIERVYLSRRSFTYDLRIIARTAMVVLQSLVGAPNVGDPPELVEARALRLLG